MNEDVQRKQRDINTGSQIPCVDYLGSFFSSPF